MPGVIINWKAENAYPRLIAALVATTDAKIDYHQIVAVYGQGATYNAIEGRFRIIKKEAADLKAAHANGTVDNTPATATANGSAAGTPTKKKAAGGAKKEKVVGGRVNKSPAKKGGKKAGKVKVEEEEVANGMDDGEGGGEMEEGGFGEGGVEEEGVKQEEEI